MKTCFFAYPSQVISIVYTLQSAITIVNSSRSDIFIRDWQTLFPTGQILIKRICQEIDDCDVFICDLTFVNPNVLFEFGYAITTGKRVWISQDKELFDKETVYNELGLLSTIGYTNYKNANDLATEFLQQAPFNDLENTLYNQKLLPTLYAPKEPKILYLQSANPTPIAVNVTRQLKHSDYHQQLVIDDPKETSNRSLEWYIEKLQSSFGVVAHFTGAQPINRNAKYALICGMAYGLAKKLLMLTETSYKPATDFRDMVTECSSAEVAGSKVNEWLTSIHSEYKKHLARYEEFETHQQRQQSRNTLKSIDIGDYEAEGEETKLAHYFLETSAYREALKASQYMIFVGRKGSGKTANYYRLAQVLRENSNIVVCLIKPIAIELEGIFQLFALSLSRAETSNLIESLWKFLIYTEIASDMYKDLYLKPTEDYTKHELELFHYVEKTDFIREDFTIRMDRAIRDICKINLHSEESPTDQKKKISEALHDGIISHLRNLLGNVLAHKEKVVVIIDNLDKAWNKSNNLSQLSQFLFGLLDISQRIPIEFYNSDSRKPRVTLSLIIFIRSDIFSAIRIYASEQDKLRTSLVNWSDNELLQRVIEERFRNWLGSYRTASEIWETYFARSIRGLPTKEYLVSRILPRPRDMIFICKQALAHATNHEHPRIEENDIKQAEADYSKHTCLTLLDETETQFPKMEALLIAFMDATEIVSYTQIEELVQSAGISRDDTDTAIDLLVDASFLGLEIRPDEFHFVYDDRKRDRQTQATKVAPSKEQQRFKINAPFHSYLEIRTAN